MNRITLALALFYLPSSVHGLCSASTCEELGWFETQQVNHGSQHVCGESEVMGCSGEIHHADAEIFCGNNGARLCTLSELEQDETRATGCGYDRALVWSSTSCDGGAGFIGYHTLYGKQKISSETVCTSAQASTTAVARCCADAESVVNDPEMCPPTAAFETDSETGACFHSNGTVLLETGASKQFFELSVGDVIKTSDEEGVFSFSPVVTLPHKKNTEPAAFLSLTTESGKKVDMTSDHFIPRCDQEVLTAGELVVGDCLMTVDGKENLIDVSWSKKSGVYTAVTENKFIVVDGIIASPFSKNSDPNYPAKDYEKYRIELELERTRALIKKKAFQETPTARGGLRVN